MVFLVFLIIIPFSCFVSGQLQQNVKTNVASSANFTVTPINGTGSDSRQLGIWANGMANINTAKINNNLTLVIDISVDLNQTFSAFSSLTGDRKSNSSAYAYDRLNITLLTSLHDDGNDTLGYTTVSSINSTAYAFVNLDDAYPGGDSNVTTEGQAIWLERLRT